MSLEKNIVTLMVLLGLLLLHSNKANAATFTVGDQNGWDLGVAGWEEDKNFTKGDIFVFNYNPKLHNVIVVDKASYDSCKRPPGAKAYRTGKEELTLARGPNYFICGINGHCNAGMKIAAIAA